jgi:hypothetical protein
MLLFLMNEDEERINGNLPKVFISPLVTNLVEEN